MRIQHHRHRRGFAMAILIVAVVMISALMLSTVSAQSETTAEQLNLTATASILIATQQALGTPIVNPVPPSPEPNATVIGFIEPIAATATTIIQQATQTAIASGVLTGSTAQAIPQTADNTGSTLVLVLVIGIVMAVIGYVIGQRQAVGKRKNS